ncbi:Transcriptional activator of fatty acid utilization, partial [Podila clonocystis]
AQQAQQQQQQQQQAPPPPQQQQQLNGFLPVQNPPLSLSPQTSTSSIQDINTCIDDLESKHTHNTLVYIMESLKLTDSDNQTTRKAYDLVVEKKSETLNTVPTEISLPPDRTLPTRSTDLPSVEIRDHLVDTYFTYRYPVWPIVHKKIFLEQLHDPNNTPSLLLLNALFAYASRYSSWQILRSDPNKPESAGQLFLERAQAMLPAFLMAPRLSTVQALLFLAQLEDNSTQRHTYHSMAVRMAQLLDLHRNCQHLGLPDDEKETRRCIWWTCYMNDRLLALSTRKPSIIHDGDCTIDLPFQEHLYDGPGKNSVSLSHYYSPPQLFYQLLLLSKIVGLVLKHFTRVAHKKYRSPDAHEVALTSLDESLFTWLASLPDHLQYTPPPDVLSAKTLPSPFVAALHLYFYSILHTLHNPYMDSSNPRATPDMPKSSPALERCSLAASMITSLSRSLCFQPQYGLNFGTQCYAILHAAIMHLTNTANTTSYQSLKSKSQFISTLSVIKAYAQHYAFEGVKKSSDVMDNIYNWQVARHQDDSPSPSLAPSSSISPSLTSVSSPNMGSTMMREVKHPDHHHVLHHIHHPYLRSESTPSSPRMAPSSMPSANFPSLGIPSSPAHQHETPSALTARARHAWPLSHSNSVSTTRANTPLVSGNSPMLNPESDRAQSSASSAATGSGSANNAVVNCSSEPTPESQALLSDIYSSNPTITFDNGRVSPLDSTSLGAILGFELPHSANEDEDNAYWNAQANSLGGMDGWNQQLMTAQEHVSYEGTVGGPAGYLGGNNSFGSLEPNYFDSLGAATGVDFSSFGVGATGAFGGNTGLSGTHSFVFQTALQQNERARQQQQGNLPQQHQQARQQSMPPQNNSQPSLQQPQPQHAQPLPFQTATSSSMDVSDIFVKQEDIFVKPESFQFSRDLVNQVYQKSLSVLETTTSTPANGPSVTSMVNGENKSMDDFLLDPSSNSMADGSSIGAIVLPEDPPGTFFNAPFDLTADDTAMGDAQDETSW